MQTIAANTYTDKYKRMNTVSEEVKQLSSLIKSFTTDDTFVTYLAEFPSVVGRECHHEIEESKVKPPGCHMKHNNTKTQSRSIGVSRLEKICQDTMQFIDNSMSLTLPAANEVLVFVLSDLDRLSSGETPHAVPIGYALKGSTLPTTAFRNMVLQFLQECSRKGLYVPCTSFDGQWWQIVVRSFSNKPLTLFEVMRDVGHEARRTVKSHIIQFLANEIGEGHLTMDDIQAIVTQEIVMLDDASISDHVVGDRMGGTMNLPPNVIDSLDPAAVDDLHKITSEAAPDKHTACHATGMGGDHVEDYIGIDEMQSRAERHSIDQDSQEINSDENPFPGHVDGVHVHKHPESKLEESDIDAMCKSLQEAKGTHAFNNTSDLTAVFNQENIASLISKAQLKATLLPVREKLRWSGIAVNFSWPKARLLQTIRIALGLEIVEIDVPQKTISQQLNAMKKASLNFVYSSMLYKQRYSEFKCNAYIADNVTVMNDAKSSRIWFSQPEYLPHLNLHHFSFIDPSHILTCLWSLICRKGIPDRNIKTEAWISVAADGKANGSNLSMSHVDSSMLVDKQKVVIAEKIFSEEVQKVMEERGFVSESTFCEIVRQWFEAEDMRGLSAYSRFQHHLRMRDWLLDGIDISTYRPIGQFINGIPTSTFQAILTNCERSTQMYPYVRSGAYNARAKGTLENETLFGEFHELDPRNIGFLNPKDVPKVMTLAMQLDLVRLNPKRYLYHHNTNRRLYKVMNESTGTQLSKINAH